MPLVQLIEASEAPLLLRDLFAGGDPGPIAAALAQVPELCTATLPFIGAALSPSLVPVRLKEIAILRTSAVLGCRYCVDAHTVVALDTGLSGAEVAALRGEGDVQQCFSDQSETALIHWIDAVAGGRGAIEASIGDALQSYFADHIIVELTVTIGATMFLNRFATALGLPSSTDTLRRLHQEGFAHDRG